MEELLTSGRVFDLALAVLVAEFAGLVMGRRRTPPALQPADLAGQLLAGGFLLLAMRLFVGGADYRWTLACLTASFPAHVFDVRRRWRR